MNDEEKDTIIEGAFGTNKAPKAEPEPMSQEEFEDLLIAQGLMIPASDFVHFYVRNMSYQKLIESDEFKASGLNLDEILSDDYLQGVIDQAKTNTSIMRYVTEKVVAKMQEVSKEETDG